MKILRMVALTLVMIGAVVWGILGLFNINLVAAIFGDATILSRIIYSLVGISAIVLMCLPNHEECFCDCTEKPY